MSGILSHIPTGSVLHRIGEGNSELDVSKLLNRIREDLHPGQRAFVDDDKTEILGISAGYGAGKTRALAAKSVFMAAANQGFTGCVMEPTGPLIRDIWQADFEGFLEQYEIPYTFRASPLPEYVLHFPSGDSKLLCRSFENYSRIIGLNLAYILCDEIDTVNPAICTRAFPQPSRSRSSALSLFLSAPRARRRSLRPPVARAALVWATLQDASRIEARVVQRACSVRACPWRCALCNAQAARGRCIHISCP